MPTAPSSVQIGLLPPRVLSPRFTRGARLQSALVLALALLLGACSPTYVLRAGYEQAKILSRRQPLERMVRDPHTDSTTRARLRLVLEVRAFATDALRLDVGQSYTTYSRVDSDPLLHVLSGAHKDAFKAHTWWFPIVGHVPYKGFFDVREGERERERLERQGLDTSLRPADAFSTLGWFNDPLLSTLLRADDLQLANTVIHEVTHNTLYLPGQAAFNESFANFVGARGAISFFCTRDGPEALECQAAEAAWHDEMRFGAFLSALVIELEALYGRDDLSREQKLELREGVFTRAQERFRDEVQPRLRGLRFDSFVRHPLNNATLIGRRLYYQRLELFEALYQHYGDLPATLQAILHQTRGATDGFTALEELLPRERVL
jgi:predicted aminopeptidase